MVEKLVFFSPGEKISSPDLYFLAVGRVSGGSRTPSSALDQATVLFSTLILMTLFFVSLTSF